MKTNPKAPAKFLFVMDAYETLNLQTETSLLLMQALVNRGARVFWSEQDDLALAHGRPIGRVLPVFGAEPLKRGAPRWSDLNGFDAVVVRKDPPFDSNYLHLTLVLDHLDAAVVQFNEARALRDFNEKMLPLRWPALTPPTLVSMSADQIERFITKHSRVVLKPLDDCSGRGIVTLDRELDPDCRGAIRQALLDSAGRPRFLVAQKYLPGVRRGDKRVYLVDGKPLGLVNRIPRTEGALANIHQGAICAATQLSAKESRAVSTIGPFLSAQGIFLAGADFIDGYLTELNITSPSALRQINAVGGERLEERIVDAMLERLARGRPGATAPGRVARVA